MGRVWFIDHSVKQTEPVTNEMNTQLSTRLNLFSVSKAHTYMNMIYTFLLLIMSIFAVTISQN